VFDWNRAGLDGQPRELHLEQSLASIDFNDFEPALASHATRPQGDATVRELARCPLFVVEQWNLAAGRTAPLAPGIMHILGAVSGELSVESAAGRLLLQAGEFALVPASVTATLQTATGTSFLRAEAGH